MLYGRQEIRVPNRLSTFQQIGYVINLCTANFRCLRLHTPQSDALSSSQIAWVLYGQASRAISIG